MEQYELYARPIAHMPVLTRKFFQSLAQRGLMATLSVFARYWGLVGQVQWRRLQYWLRTRVLPVFYVAGNVLVWLRHTVFNALIFLRHAVCNIVLGLWWSIRHIRHFTWRRFTGHVGNRFYFYKNYGAKFFWHLRKFGYRQTLERSWAVLKPRINRTLFLMQARPDLLKQINRLYSGKRQRPIIIYPPVIDWNSPLVQRPHHIARGMAQCGYPFVFCTPNVYGGDPYYGLEQVEPNLYVTMSANIVREQPGPVIRHLYGTDIKLPLSDLQGYLANGDVVIYEYVDHFSESISGIPIPQEVYDRHNWVLKNKDIIVVTTADMLQKEVEAFRTENVVMLPNAVDPSHFKRVPKVVPHKIEKLVAKGKPIIGYYGAFASWYDYEMWIAAAKARPDYEFLMVGHDYDGTLPKSGALDLPNNTFTGAIPYTELPDYSYYFTVATIPFKLNDVTAATSPVKLFEYMARGKPVVATDLTECRKYKSVVIAHNLQEFLAAIDEVVQNGVSAERAAQLDVDAEANTWASRAKKLDELIVKHRQYQSLMKGSEA